MRKRADGHLCPIIAFPQFVTSNKLRKRDDGALIPISAFPQNVTLRVITRPWAGVNSVIYTEAQSDKVTTTGLTTTTTTGLKWREAPPN